MKITILSAIGVLIISLVFSMEPRDTLIIALEVFFLFYFLYRVGRKFVFLELLALIAVTQWLFAPMVVHANGGGMGVSYDKYLQYALPATVAYLFGITLPLWRVKQLDTKILRTIETLTRDLENKMHWGIILIILGFFFWITQNIVPIALNFVFYLCAQLMMIGMCLMMFSNYRWKYVWILGVMTVLVYTTVLNGMVGTVLFWVLILGMLYTTKNPYKITLISKVLFFIGFIYVLFALQITKMEYRLETWEMIGTTVTTQVRHEVQKDPELFYLLFKEKLLDYKGLLEPRNMLYLAVRLNQGELVSNTMNYVPRIQQYGGGEVTIVNTLSAFVPRIVWPEKPEVGQSEYFKKYTGITLGVFTSATLGPIGDAYADFGKGGILFLFFFGGLIGRFFEYFINKSLSTPGILIWFMVIYFASIAVSEISVASYLNLLFKYVVFIIVIRSFLKVFLKMSI